METRPLSLKETEIHEELLLIDREFVGLSDICERAYIFYLNGERGTIFSRTSSVSTKFRSWTIRRAWSSKYDKWIDQVICPDLVKFERDMIYLALMLP